MIQFYRFIVIIRRFFFRFKHIIIHGHTWETSLLYAYPFFSFLFFNCSSTMLILGQSYFYKTVGLAVIGVLLLLIFIWTFYAHR